MKHVLDLLIIALALGLLLAVADTIREMWKQKRSSGAHNQELHAIRNHIHELTIRVVALEQGVQKEQTNHDPKGSDAGP